MINKQHNERVANLVIALKQELQGFKISRFTREIEFGIIDLPMFAMRFKFKIKPFTDDHTRTVINIAEEGDIDADSLFIQLCERGYLHWLRRKLGDTSAFLHILSTRKRWQLIIDAAIEKEIEKKRGQYMLDFLRDLARKDINEIYHDDPSVFEWILF